MRHVLLLLLGLWLAPVAGQDNAFQASVVVPDQGAGARDKGLREALAQVIARVGGDGAPAQAESLLARAGALVQTYGFQRDAAGALRLEATFDARAVENGLKSLGLPVWGVHAGAVEDIDVSVGGIRGPRDYARVLGALKGAPGVKSVAVLEARGDHLALRVRAEGGAARLAGALSVGGTLLRDGDSNVSFVLAN